MVDSLTRDAAESVRIPVSARVRLLRREFQLREFVIYLGKLTHAANNFHGPSGVMRDSDSKRARKRVKSSRGTKQKAMEPVKSSVSNTRVAKANPCSNLCRGKPFFHRATHVSQKMWMGRAKLASLEASFFQSWHAERASALKPSGGATASERMAALKLRVAARGAASST